MKGTHARRGQVVQQFNRVWFHRARQRRGRFRERLADFNTGALASYNSVLTATDVRAYLRLN